MEFAPLPLEKQIKGVNQNWLNWPFTLFQVVGPHLHKNVSLSHHYLIHFSTRSIAEKRITGNEKTFRNCFGCSGDLGGSKYLLSQMTKKKKKKKTDPHKESRAKKRRKGKDNENLQDMCKNHQGLQQKKEGICKIYYLWVTVP